jgi:hypothetical protein
MIHEGDQRKEEVAGNVKAPIIRKEMVVPPM